MRLIPTTSARTAEWQATSDAEHAVSKDAHGPCMPSTNDTRPLAIERLAPVSAYTLRHTCPAAQENAPVSAHSVKRSVSVLQYESLLRVCGCCLRAGHLGRIHKCAVPSAASHVGLKLSLQRVGVPAHCRHFDDQIAGGRSGSIQPSYGIHAAKDAARPADGEGCQRCPAPRAARPSGRACR
eukprot:7389353-Prymnesium_polylepis.2